MYADSNGLGELENEDEQVEFSRAQLNEQRKAAVLAGTLRAARSGGRKALSRHQQQQEQQQQNKSWRVYLLPAARQLEEVLVSFLDFRPAWDALRVAEMTTGTMSGSQLAELSIVFDQDITGLLEFLGYTPPPQAEEWANDVVSALADLLSQPDTALAARTARRAEHDLTLFCYRLRRCIKEAEMQDIEEAYEPIIRHRVVAMVERAVLAAGPAVLATGIVAAALPPSGVAAAGLGFAATAASRKLLEVGVTAATGSLLARATANSVDYASSEELEDAANARIKNVCGNLSNFLRSHDVDVTEFIRPLAIESVSASHALRAILFHTPWSPERDLWLEQIDDTVIALGNLLDQEPSTQGWSDAAELVQIVLSSWIREDSSHHRQKPRRADEDVGGA